MAWVFEMGLHRIQADNQALGNVCVRMASRKQLENLQFTLAQLLNEYADMPVVALLVDGISVKGLEQPIEVAM